MGEDTPPSFTTKRRVIGSDGELKWGGSDGDPWNDSIETSSDISVTASGTITPGSSPPVTKNLHAQFDVSIESGFSDGEQLTGLVDQSTNTNDLTNGTATYRENTRNGLPAAEFDGETDTLFESDGWGPISKPVTVYVAGDIEATNYIQVITTNGNYAIMVGDDQYYVNWSEYQHSSGYSAGPTILTGYYDGSTTRLRENGTTQFEMSDTTTPGMDNFAIGGEYGSNDRPLWGYIGEVLVYDVAHLNSTITEIESYLSNKWNI